MVQMDASECLQWDYGYQDRRSWGDDATDALDQSCSPFERERERVRVSLMQFHFAVAYDLK